MSLVAEEAVVPSGVSQFGTNGAFQNLTNWLTESIWTPLNRYASVQQFDHCVSCDHRQRDLWHKRKSRIQDRRWWIKESVTDLAFEYFHMHSENACSRGMRLLDRFPQWSRGFVP